MSINLEGAESYFSKTNHVKAPIWKQFSEESHTAAIAAARRVLSRDLGRALNDDESAYVEGDRTRDEFAVYEQALYMLECGQIADAANGDPAPILTGEADVGSTSPTPTSQKSQWAPDALRWLGAPGACMING